MQHLAPGRHVVMVDWAQVAKDARNVRKTIDSAEFAIECLVQRVVLGGCGGLEVKRQ